MSGTVQLSGQQVRQILDAVLSGFDRSDLRAMTRLELDQELDDIAGGDSLQDVALSLIAWAEREGKTRDLVAALGRYNPDNPQVQALVRDAAGWFAADGRVTAAAPAPGQPAAPAGAASAPSTRKPAQADAPAPYLVPPPAPSKSSDGRWVKIVIPLLLLGGLCAIALGGQGMLGDILRINRQTGQTTPAATGAATAAPTVGQADAAVPATAVAPATEAPAAVAPANGQPLLVGYDNQRWRLGDVAYQILDAQAVRVGPQQTSLDLRLRALNDGKLSTLVSAEGMRLVAGDRTAEPLNGDHDCRIVVDAQAARDDCSVKFLIDSAADSMTLVLSQGDTQRSVPLTFSPAASGSAPSASLLGGFSVSAPPGVLSQGTMAWQVLSAAAELYDDTHTAVTLQLAATNNGSLQDLVASGSLRLLEDDVPRVPNQAGTDCQTVIDPGATLPCTVEFVVGTATQDLKLRMLPEGSLPDLIVPIPLTRVAQ